MLGTTLSATACDQPAERGPEVEGQWRSGGHLDHGRRYTLNTNAVIPASARDTNEFRDNGDPTLNSYGYETRFATVYHPDTPYGPLTTNVQGPNGGPTVKLHPDGDFQFEVRGPTPAYPEFMLTGAQLVGMQMIFEIKDPSGFEYTTYIVVADHMVDESGYDLYEFRRADTGTELDVPLCENSEDYGRFARVTSRLHVDGETGDIDIQAPSLRHIGCLSAVPGKAMLLGYSPTASQEDEFVLATRIVRADYCADGHPYTFPGNLFTVLDNKDSMLTLGDLAGTLAPDERIEAMWDEHGVLCVGTPRAFNIVPDDIVCPTKHLANGAVVHNWQPPPCDGYVDDPDPGLRMFSVTTISE